MSINLEHILGFHVRVTNVLDAVTEGSVYSFNSSNGTLTLIVKQNGGKNSVQNVSFKIIKASFIKSLEVVGAKPSSGSNSFRKQVVKPTYVHVDRVQQVLQDNVRLAQKRSLLLGKGVTKEAQFIFDLLYKTVSDTKWSDKSIIVLDDVEIVPPYKLENIRSLHDSSRPETGTLVKRIVARAWDMLANQDRKGG